MKQDVIQTSFTSGEFGPSLFGRTDIAQYANACAIVQNWLVRPFGSLISTPGTQFVNQCVTGGSTTLTGVRLIPFTFSVTDAYIIEMGVGYFRFYNNGAVVVSNGTAYTVAHSYSTTDIPSIQYRQNHDVLYLFHGNYPPQTLTRNASNNWVLAPFFFFGGPFMAPNTSGALTLTISGLTGTQTVVATGAVFNANMVPPNAGYAWWSLGPLTTSSTTGLDLQGFFQLVSIQSPSNATVICGAGISPLCTGGTTIWAEGSWSPYRGYPARCTFFQSRLFAARTNTEPQTVWGSQNFAFGNFNVNGGSDDDALNLQLSAVQGNDIKWMLGMNDLIVGTYGGEFIITAGIGTGNPLTPASACVIPQTSWGSEPIIPKKIGNFCYYVQRGAQKLREIAYEWLSTTYKSSDRTILSPHIPGGGFVDISYQQNPDTVLWALCSNGTLATMTREVDQQVQGWARQVTQGSYISIASIPSLQGPYDEVWVIVTRTINGKQVNYIERFASQLLPMQGPGSQKVQQDQLFYVHCGLTYDAFTSTNTSGLTQLLTDGGFEIWTNPSTSTNWIQSTVGSLAKTTNPVYAGTYSAGLTFSGGATYVYQAYAGFAAIKGQQVTLGAWVWCATPGTAHVSVWDNVSNFASAYHPGDSQWHYLTISITISLSATFLQFYMALDSAGTAYFDLASASIYSNLTPVNISLNATSGTIVVTSSSGYFLGSNVGLRLRAVDAYDNVLGEMKITGYTSSTIIVGSVSTVFTAPSYSSGYWGISANIISGLNQLEQSSVVALGDGVPVPGPFVVSNGTITLPSDYFLLTAGLQAPQIFVSLPKELPNERGTSVGKKQRINEVAFKVLNSYTGFYIGGTSGTLYPAVPSTPSTLYTGIMPNITFSDSTGGGYPYGAQLQIYNSVPLPIELLSTVITVDTQEK